MKILHVVPTYFPAIRYGGPIYSVHELNKWLVKNGVEVTVYTTNIDGPNDLSVSLSKPVIIDGVIVIYFKSSWPRSWFYSKDLKSALEENIKDFDLVHITSVFLSASYLGAKYAKKFNKPYIISSRGSLIPELISKKSSFIKKNYIKFIENKNLDGASAIHFTTKYEEDMYKELGLPLKKSIIIPNGIGDITVLSNTEKKENERKLRDKLKIPSDAEIVLSLGRLNWKKGFDTLIPTFAKVIKENSKAILLVVGNDGDEPGYKKQIEKICNDCNATDKIIFSGDLRGDEKDAAYSMANVFVMPSYSENFGIAPVESMAHGTPVIVSKNVGIAPDIKEAMAGIVVEKDVDKLGEAIIDILRDKYKAGRFSENGKKLVREKYSWPEIAKSWITEYNEIIKSNT